MPSVGMDTCDHCHCMVGVRKNLSDPFRWYWMSTCIVGFDGLQECAARGGLRFIRGKLYRCGFQRFLPAAGCALRFSTHGLCTKSDPWSRLTTWWERPGSSNRRHPLMIRLSSDIAGKYRAKSFSWSTPRPGRDRLFAGQAHGQDDPNRKRQAGAGDVDVFH